MFLISYSRLLLVALLIAPSADSTADNFKELGHLFLWGIMAALCLAVIVVVIWLKIQSKRDASSDYVSINPSRHGNQS